MGVITLNKLEPGKEFHPEVQPIKVTYSYLKEIAGEGNLIPGQLYRIVDYVTTVNEKVISNVRSAGHQFDIVVMALTADTLSEDALAVQHDGDTYFNGSRLQAWELKYRLDNVQWSKQAGTYVTDEDSGYTFLVIGDITLSGHTYKLLQGFGMYVEDWSDYALMETVAEGEQIICYYGVPEEFDPEEPEVVGTASGVEEMTEAGRGTITWMKDEHGNECPYDFKNIQYKRYMTTDSVSGRDGLDGKYMVADPDNCPQGLSVEDTEDFIWAYTFSSDNAGGEQTDYSLTADHQVHDNVMKANGSELNNIAFFGNQNYNMSFGNSNGNMSFGNGNYNLSFGNECYGMSFGNQNRNMSFGNWNNNMSFGNNCYSMSFGNENNGMSFGNDCRNGTITEGVQYVDIPANTWNFQLLNGLAGTGSSHLAPSFATQKAYTQVACKNSSGQLKIYVPGDLV